jgi:hypothetical protein
MALRLKYFISSLSRFPTTIAGIKSNPMEPPMLETKGMSRLNRAFFVNSEVDVTLHTFPPGKCKGITGKLA